MKNLLKIVYFISIFAYIKADCDIDLDRANLEEDDIPGNIYLNLTDIRIKSKCLLFIRPCVLTLKVLPKIPFKLT